MTKIFSKALCQNLEVERIIGTIGGNDVGPCIVFIGGIHGNESSGVFALHKVLSELQTFPVPVNGKIIAVCGHLKALEANKRYFSKDLNRMWTRGEIAKLESGSFHAETEDEKEQAQLYDLLQEILKQEKGPFYFFDLHTTSGETIPFLTVNDSLLNLKFTSQYPLPQIFGIEEYIDGPLLSYINTLGYVSFGYEAGQHDDLSSIEHHIAFIYLSLVFAAAINKKDIDFNRYFQQLARSNPDSRDIYRIFYRHNVNSSDRFKMERGFLNFQKISKGTHLASTEQNKVNSPHTARLFMPLYQEQGSDGFFLIKKISPWFLKCSKWMRSWKFDRVLTLMPGINWANEKREELVMDRRIARWFAPQFFHLLGYRSIRIDRDHFILSNREAAARYRDYKGTKWW